jgi:hypothetical protein
LWLTAGATEKSAGQFVHPGRLGSGARCSNQQLTNAIQLVIAVGFTLVRTPLPFHDDWFFAAYVGTTLLASYATNRWFEGPAQAMIRGTLLSRQRHLLGQASG